MADAMNTPSLLLVLHDVTPQSWADYQPFVEAVDALGEVPMTWLVVPDFHKHHHLDSHPVFRSVLTRRIELGDELALHGYYHCDDSPLTAHPRDWFMRRVYTHEGEFYSLSQPAALARLLAGIELFSRYHWPLEGFVAPAWLMSEGTRQALRQLPLSYTSDSQHLYRLPDFSRVNAPGLVWSARSTWRRGVSKIISAQRELRWQHAPVIRLGVHPVDLRHEFSRTYWLQTLERLLNNGRVPMTKARWLRTQSAQVGRAA
ncbi:polysaccharide deacetylase family protein [Pseudomonas helvetica]|uniref:polysaccharide deacetylase family protein n=1 Tax=Pseudomonas helvetica TaxID=3136738 RepID=UPI0032648250